MIDVLNVSLEADEKIEKIHIYVFLHPQSTQKINKSS